MKSNSAREIIFDLLQEENIAYCILQNGSESSTPKPEIVEIEVPLLVTDARINDISHSNREFAEFLKKSGKRKKVKGSSGVLINNFEYRPEWIVVRCRSSEPRGLLFKFLIESGLSGIDDYHRAFFLKGTTPEDLEILYLPNPIDRVSWVTLLMGILGILGSVSIILLTASIIPNSLPWNSSTLIGLGICIVVVIIGLLFGYRGVVLILSWIANKCSIPVLTSIVEGDLKLRHGFDSSSACQVRPSF